jgi:hypothetical protein
MRRIVFGDTRNSRAISASVMVNGNGPTDGVPFGGIPPRSTRRGGGVAGFDCRTIFKAGLPAIGHPLPRLRLRESDPDPKPSNQRPDRGPFQVHIAHNMGGPSNCHQLGRAVQTFRLCHRLPPFSENQTVHEKGRSFGVRQRERSQIQSKTAQILVGLGR